MLLVGSEEVALATGDLAFLPHGLAHTLADARAGDVPALGQLRAEYGSANGTRLRYGGDRARTEPVGAVVHRLSRYVGLSRSALAMKFRERVGRSP